MNDKLCIGETVRSIGERISEQLKNSIFHKHVEEKHGRAVQQRPINRGFRELDHNALQSQWRPYWKTAGSMVAYQM